MVCEFISSTKGWEYKLQLQTLVLQLGTPNSYTWSMQLGPFLDTMGRACQAGPSRDAGKGVADRFQLSFVTVALKQAD